MTTLMVNNNKGLLNLLLSTASFAVSSAGSVLLYIVFAIIIYEKSKSALLTSLFISLQWLPVLLVILCRSDWDHGMNPRTRWYLIDIASALLTLPILLFVKDFNYGAIIVILFARGLLDQINRINRTVAAKILFPKAKLAYYAAFLQTGYHIGISLGALGGIFLKKYIDLDALVLINVGTFVVSALLILSTRCIENVRFPKYRERQSLKIRMLAYQTALQSDARLFYCAMLPPTTATFFQGTYSVLQPIFPMKGLGLGASEVSFSYVLATIAILLGSFAFSSFSKKYRLFDKCFSDIILLASGSSILACASYMMLVSTNSPLVSAAFFTIMVFLYEFIWMNGYAGIVAFAPEGQLGTVFGITFCIGCTLASVVSGLVGLVIDMTNNNFVVSMGIFMTLYLGIIFSAWVVYNKLIGHQQEHEREISDGILD